MRHSLPNGAAPLRFGFTGPAAPPGPSTHRRIVTPHARPAPPSISATPDPT